jgi:hypothetical protein
VVVDGSDETSKNVEGYSWKYDEMTRRLFSLFNLFYDEKGINSILRELVRISVTNPDDSPLFCVPLP